MHRLRARGRSTSDELGTDTGSDESGPAGAVDQAPPGRARPAACADEQPHGWGGVLRQRTARQYRPSMFLTLTLPSYGADSAMGRRPIRRSYDYRRAALDAMLFPRLVDQFWKTLRRAAGYEVQYFSAVEPQRRLAPHLHAAIRGAIPRRVLRQVAAATYLQVWWPAFDQRRLHRRLPQWTGDGYADPATGELLPTWDEALDAHRQRSRRSAGACDAVRQAARHPGHRAWPTGRRPGHPVSDEVHHQGCRRHPRRRPGRAAPGAMSTGCTASCASCPARNGARTGCVTASNPRRPALVWHPASAPAKPTAANTSASAAAGCWSPASGPPRHSPGIAPTGPTWSGQPWNRPGSSHPTPNACPPASKPPMVAPGSCGSRSIGMTSATPR